MTTKNSFFRITAVLLSVFLLLPGLPLTGTAQDLTEIYLSPCGEDAPPEFFTGITYDEPVYIAPAEEDTFCRVTFTDCIFSAGIILEGNEEIEIELISCETPSLTVNGDHDRYVNVPWKGASVCGLPNDTEINLSFSKLYAMADHEKVQERLDAGEEYCWFLNGMKATAAEPFFSFYSDCYVEWREIWGDNGFEGMEPDIFNGITFFRTSSLECRAGTGGYDNIAFEITNDTATSLYLDIDADSSNHEDIRINTLMNLDFEKNCPEDCECGCHEDGRFCEECSVIPDDFTPGILTVTGKADGINVFFGGRTDISGFTVEDRFPIFNTLWDDGDITLGENQSVLVIGGKKHGIIHAENGAEILDTVIGSDIDIFLEDGVLHSTQAALENNSAVIFDPVDGAEYGLQKNGESIPFTPFRDEENGTLVLLVSEENVPADVETDGEKKCLNYDLLTYFGNICYVCPIYDSSNILATEYGTSFHNRRFGGTVNIYIPGGDARNSVLFENCEFDDFTEINVISDNFSGEISFIGENSFGENMRMNFTSSDRTHAFNGDLIIQNAPSCIIYEGDTYFRLCGDEDGAEYSVNGVKVTTGEEYYELFTRLCCYEDHGDNWEIDHSDCGKFSSSLTCAGDIVDVQLINNEEKQTPVNEICFERPSRSPYLTVDVDRPFDGLPEELLRIRMNDPGYDENGEPLPNEVKIRGSIADNDLELTGNTNIEELSFDAGEDGERNISIGLWGNRPPVVVIGSHSVTLTGNSPESAVLIAADGAVIHSYDFNQYCAVIKEDEFISLQGAHIFGKDGWYGVYLPGIHEDAEYSLIITDGTVLTGDDLIIEEIPDDNKTHLTPAVEYDGNINNWILLANISGISFEIHLPHKSWVCAHENAEIHTVNGIDPPDCENGGWVFVICYDCESYLPEWREQLTENGEHTPEKLEGTPAGCTTDGLTDGEICTVCGKILKEQEIIPAAGHKAVTDAGLEATCSSIGITDGSHCEICGTVLEKQEIIPQKEHTPVTDKEVKATCTTEGFTEGSHCEVCGKILVKQESLGKLRHVTETDKGIAATCTSIGLTDGTYCRICGTVLTKQEIIDMLPHTPVTDKAVAPTCSKEGLTEGSHCEVCGKVLAAQQPIAKTSHTPVTDEAVAPTSNSTGLTAGSHCAVCGLTLTPQLIILECGHEVAPEDIAKAPTCTETGLTKAVKCADCGETIEAEKIIPALGHDYSEKVFAPTCTADGYTLYTCSRCGDEYTDGTVQSSGHKMSRLYDEEGHWLKCEYCDETGTKEGHSYDEGTVTKEATATETGCIVFKCTVCGDEKDEIIPATGVSFIPGDVDGNGAVESADARLALRASVGLADAGMNFKDVTTREFLAADVDNNGVIESSDARTILRVSVGLETL